VSRWGEAGRSFRGGRGRRSRRGARLLSAWLALGPAASGTVRSGGPPWRGLASAQTGLRVAAAPALLPAAPLADPSPHPPQRSTACLRRPLAARWRRPLSQMPTTLTWQRCVGVWGKQPVRACRQGLHWCARGEGRPITSNRGTPRPAAAPCLLASRVPCPPYPAPRQLPAPPRRPARPPPACTLSTSTPACSPRPPPTRWCPPSPAPAPTWCKQFCRPLHRCARRGGAGPLNQHTCTLPPLLPSVPRPDEEPGSGSPTQTPETPSEPQ
jgi:hypothetical protein